MKLVSGMESNRSTNTCTSKDRNIKILKRFKMVMMLTNSSQVKENLQYVHISVMEPMKKTKRGVWTGDEWIASSLGKQKNVN